MSKRTRVWVASVIFLAVAAYGTNLTARPRVEVVSTLISADVVRHGIAPPYTRLHIVVEQEADRTFWTRAVPRDVVSKLQKGDVVKLYVAAASLRSSNDRPRTFGVTVGGVELRSELRDVLELFSILVLLPLALVGVGVRRLRAIKKQR